MDDDRSTPTHDDVIVALLEDHYMCGCPIRLTVIGHTIVSEGCGRLHHELSERAGELAKYAVQGLLCDAG